MVKVDFYYDYVSPYSYLAYTQRQRLVDAGAELVHHPVFLSGIVRALGITPPIAQPGPRRATYLMEDLMRWAAWYGVPMGWPAAFPFNSLPLMRAASLAQERGILDAWSERCFAAAWAEGRDVTEPAVMGEIASSVGLDPAEVAEWITRPQVKAGLTQVTDQAMERGVFGLPTFFVAEEQFWGNDRLHFVLAEIKRKGAQP